MAYTAFDLSATVPMPQLPSYSQQQQPQPQPPTGPPAQLSGGNRSSQGGQSGLRSSNSNSMGNMTRNSQNGIQARGGVCVLAPLCVCVCVCAHGRSKAPAQLGCKGGWQRGVGRDMCACACVLLHVRACVWPDLG